MLEPFSFGMFCFFGYTAATATVMMIISGMGYGEIRNKRLRETRWDRNKCKTKMSLGEISHFLIWFQDHTELASHIVEGIQGILAEPCTIPALGTSFQYNDVVLKLSQTGTYYLDISGDNLDAIDRFWARVTNYA